MIAENFDNEFDMRVFVTGATGFIGQAMTRELLKHGWDVTALVRRPESSQAKAVQALGANVVQGDILNVDSMRDHMQGAEIVIHSAGVYEYGVTGKKKKQMYDINVTGTENVLGLALECQIPRTVYVSTTLVYGDTGEGEPVDETFRCQKPYPNFYARTKSQAHEIAMRYVQKGLPLVIACPNGVMGPNDHSVFGYFLRLYLNNLMAPFAWGPNIMIAVVHVDDLASGLVLAAEKGKPGETYIFSGESITRREMLDIWGSKPGRFKVRFYVPGLVAGVLYALVSPLLRVVGLPAFISWETVRAPSSNTSSQKAQDELEWSHRPAGQLWLEIIDAELELRQKRRKRDLISMLKPM